MPAHRALPLARSVTALTLLALLGAANDAGAVGTRTFSLDSLEELSGGDLKGVAVSSDGVVRAGWTLGNAPLPDSTAVFSALPLADGTGVLVGTSPAGKIYKVSGDQVTAFADTGELAVTSMVQAPNGTVFAATIPNGKIFRVVQGKVTLHAALKDVEHVWALALDKAKTAIFAGTGPDGKLFRVGLDGSSSVYFDSDEPHLVSLAVDETTGDVFAGSSGKAILHRVSGPGRASVLFDFPGDEVKAVSIAKGGVVFAIANEYAEPPEPPKRSASAGRTPAAPTTAPRPKPGKGALYRFDASGRAEKMMSHADFHYTALAVDEAGDAYVGTGAEGRVYMVNDAHAVTLVADTDERQIGALGVATGAAGAKAAKGGVTFAAAGDPSVFHRLVAQGGADAVWTSKPLDAGLRAKLGRLTWRASGAGLELSARTGNTAAPDTTWTPWSAAIAQGAVVPSPPGRYVQVRARWGKDPNATLSDVLLAFVTDNVRPVVLEVSAAQRGATRDTKEGAVASGGEAPKHDSVVKVTWKVDNPDSDALRYRLAFRRDGQAMWRDVNRTDEVVTKTEYEWDTLALPEGKYRVRVEASDEPANPPEQVQRHALESSSVLVDNTPPVVSNLTVRGRRLKARIVDALGPIARAEIAVDGRLDWRPLAPADGVFDSADETVDTDVSSLVPAGSHIVALRAYDAAGNSVVQETEAN